MFDTDKDETVEPADTALIGAEADAVLDHALREQEVEHDATEFDDDEPQADEAEDYVLYSEVKPHLEALVALQKERGRFIELMLYARDRVSSPAAAERIDDGLHRLGIDAIRPDGEVFDPAHHEAAATVETADASLHGLVAETETAGYVDNGQVVRPPIVTVYRAVSEGTS